MAVTREQPVKDYPASWQEQGFLTLPAFYGADEVARVDNVVKRVWTNKTSSVVVDNLISRRRSRVADLSDEERRQPFKVNDLFLDFEEIRRISLKEEMVRILTSLLGEPPVLVNTLNLEKSSQQAAHVDALYMTPHTPNHLVATWIALEDGHPDAGPLFYYPGSHKIPLYTFSNGSYHALSEEMRAWSEYIESQIASRNLPKTYFHPRKGDAFIWHANLVHGGGQITNPTLTRKSLVSHFFSLPDMRAMGLDIAPLGPGFWWRRDPQPVPEPPRQGWSLGGLAQRVVRRLRGAS